MRVIGGFIGVIFILLLIKILIGGVSRGCCVRFAIFFLYGRGLLINFCLNLYMGKQPRILGYRSICDIIS